VARRLEARDRGAIRIRLTRALILEYCDDMIDSDDLSTEEHDVIYDVIYDAELSPSAPDVKGRPRPPDGAAPRARDWPKRPPLRLSAATM
jgi:hypothetical protein